jgi:hypothetical protein
MGAGEPGFYMIYFWQMNRLEKEKSPYLRHAATQAIDWHPWSDEAFRRAKEEDKPVFLSSGAIWCHWCHVQARECFENPEIAALLNENFISIKLDRDERPDVDRRYQEALAAMGEPGGWPLSIFLTPEGKPFYGGTYFPPEEGFGRPGFKKVLREVAKFYRENGGKARDYSERVMGHLRPRPLQKSALGERMLAGGAQSMVDLFDPENGGFGRYPKFPMPGALAFLTGRYFFGGNPAVGHAVRKTLVQMAKGGIRDHLGGGFHRYSTDAGWIIPHFEKMGEDNAWLLRNYVEAYHVFGEPSFREVAEEIVGFVRSTLSDPEGGFYSSQDADVVPEDEGGYFTWTMGDFREALGPDEFDIAELEVARMSFLHDRGRTHHDERKHVLFAVMEPVEIAEKTGLDAREVERKLASAKRKLLAARNTRTAPVVDKTLYSFTNGLFISSYLLAWRHFGDGYLLDFALKSLKRILCLNARDGVLYRTGEVRGVLDDHVHMVGALIDAYECTADREYAQLAEGLMRTTIENFWEKTSYGFFDSAEEVAGLRLKQIEDVPHPSANALAAWHLVRLYQISRKNEYLKLAEDSLGAFSSVAEGLSIHGGAFYLALDGFFHHMALAVNCPLSGGLGQAALRTFRPYKIISYGEDSGLVLPCKKGRCLEAERDADALQSLLLDPRA